MIWSRRQVLLKAGGAWVGASAAISLGRPALGREAASVRDGTAVPDRTAVGDGTVVRDGTAAGDGTAVRRIALTNLHTDERLHVDYRRNGEYVPEALSAIEVLLRDFRTGERHPIDPHLMDYLLDVAHSVGAEPSFSVISGYRSAQTNASLRATSAGVAQHSLHMEGRAIDVRMKGVDCASLAARAQDLKRGGVGYYRASDFVHLDTGAVRTWKG